jgi:hypothetical protein
MSYMKEKRSRMDWIFQAAIAAMASGTKRAHCFSAHVPGQGYVNDGTTVDLQPEYCRQLEKAAQSEYENLGFAKGYAEPGYTDPENGVLFANWNRFPRNFDQLLEKAGYACEWSDEWATCEDCGKAVRTEPDSYCWKPAFRMGREDCGLFCVDCFANETDETDETE